MTNSFRSALRALAVAALMALPAVAQAAPWQWAVATTDVNLRAGPSTDYPAVATVYAGSQIQLFGCLQDWSWCDVAWSGIRGWMAGDYIEVAYNQRRYDVPDVGVVIGIPFIGFDMDSYWGDHYRDRPWYHHWHGRVPGGPGPVLPPPGGHFPPPGGHFPPPGGHFPPPPDNHWDGHRDRHDGHGDWRPGNVPPPFQQRNGVPMQGGTFGRPGGGAGGNAPYVGGHPCPPGTVCPKPERP